MLLDGSVWRTYAAVSSSIRQGGLVVTQHYKEFGQPTTAGGLGVLTTRYILTSRMIMIIFHLCLQRSGNGDSSRLVARGH